LDGGLFWPPKREDLERLYLGERLSAMKIARVYGLKYRSPKVAESMILCHLKRNGVKRRDAAEHLRKVTEKMVDDWVRRYQAGESLKMIAGRKVDPVTVWSHLKRRGVALRDRVEAQVRAVTKYERKPSKGDGVEKAYLMGLRYGDLDAVRHGRAVRVRVSTTHPAMAELFESIFLPYGMVHRYPRKAKLTGYEWTLECDLESSFEFLLKKPSVFEIQQWNDSQFLAFLAGLFDAEGSVLMHKKRKRHNPEISITNSDRELIDFLFFRLRSLKFTAFAFWKDPRPKSKFKNERGIGRVIIWRFREVQQFLRCVHLRHGEKVAKAALVQQLKFGTSDSIQRELLVRWSELGVSIKNEREHFVREAETTLRERDALKACSAGLSEVEMSRI
jgi:hypothetical protein